MVLEAIGKKCLVGGREIEVKISLIKININMSFFFYIRIINVGHNVYFSPYLTTFLKDISNVRT